MTIDEEFEPPELPSKSSLKREMQALQDMGEALSNLKVPEMEALVEDAELLDALATVRRIPSSSAKQRQFRYIAKLLSKMDTTPFSDHLEQRNQWRQKKKQAHKALEQDRDRLIAEGDPAIEACLQQYPQAERQQLRQLVLQARREAARNKPPAASRKLFRYLRELSGS